ncbi:hypothetical protein DFJ74DRAFT_702427 [Hyaloraphidium curvatum]|nr:hypothetical protein DFJ74DRAFT_702427 [Hyaloraphidium curvatum]
MAEEAPADAESNGPSLTELPPELLHRIYAFLEISSLRSLSLTCHRTGSPATAQLRILRVLSHAALGTVSCAPDCEQESCTTESRLRRSGTSAVELVLRLYGELRDLKQMTRASWTRPPDFARYADRLGVDAALWLDQWSTSDVLLAAAQGPEEPLGAAVSEHRDDFLVFLDWMHDFRRSVKADALVFLRAFNADPQLIDGFDSSASVAVSGEDFLRQHLADALSHLRNRAAYLSRALPAAHCSPHAEDLVAASASGDLATAVLDVLHGFLAEPEARCTVLPGWLARGRTIADLAGGDVAEWKTLPWEGDRKVFLCKDRLDDLGPGGVPETIDSERIMMF